MPFVGKTGEEVNRHYLPLAGLRRDSVRVTNAIRCLPITTSGKLDIKREKDLDMLYSCAETFLYPELDRNKPKLIIPMGAFACRAIDPDIDLDLHHGIPLSTDWGMAFPMYHPAGGLHEPKKMMVIRTDWVRLRKYLTGRLRVAEDPFAEQEDYAALDDPDQVHAILAGKWHRPLGSDTETMRGGDPFCITFSVEPGTGYLIRATDLRMLQALQYHIDKWTGPILFHNWLFDGTVVQKMGLRIPDRRVIDTMMLAFHLGNVPLGLKVLAYRELGMKMQDFDDLVSPYSRELVLSYYRLAYTEEWAKPDEQLVRDKEGQFRIYKPQSFSTKIKRFFTDFTKNPNKDVFEMWTKNWVDSHAEVEDRIGRWPGKCISHVPFEKVIHYACRDSDSLVRLYPILRKMKTQVRRVPQERWADAAA